MTNHDFKVGDLVVGLNPWVSLYVQKIIGVHESYVVLDTETKCKRTALRHATPSEIEVGRRL